MRLNEDPQSTLIGENTAFFERSSEWREPNFRVLSVQGMPWKSHKLEYLHNNYFESRITFNY